MVNYNQDQTRGGAGRRFLPTPFVVIVIAAQMVMENYLLRYCQLSKPVLAL